MPIKSGLTEDKFPTKPLIGVWMLVAYSIIFEKKAYDSSIEAFGQFL